LQARNIAVNIASTKALVGLKLASNKHCNSVFTIENWCWFAHETSITETIVRPELLKQKISRKGSPIKSISGFDFCKQQNIQ